MNYIHRLGESLAGYILQPSGSPPPGKFASGPQQISGKFFSNGL
jgi:hypothetical protein